MTPAASARGATRRFREVVAVDGVDLEVQPGEVVGLLGANGAGKTTLIRLVLGLLAPTGGEVSLFGEPPSRATRRRVGYVPQGLGLYEDLTVEENLAFAAAAFGGHPVALDPDLRAVGGALVRDLPLGVRRRAAFAAALSHRPDLLVLDEPTSGVDPLGRVRLWDAIRGAADAGAGVLVTTHHMEEAENCGRLMVMVDGRAAAQGALRDITRGIVAVEVRAERWDGAYTALERAGIAVGLRGRAVRAVGTPARAVRDALERAGVPARVAEVPATFEEAFVALATRRTGG